MLKALVCSVCVDRLDDALSFADDARAGRLRGCGDLGKGNRVGT